MKTLDHYRSKIKSLPEIKEAVARLRAEDKKIVFTNGCFDILHRGHARYLFAARALGDHLIVGLNSDQSVKAIKGPLRPVTPQDERGELLAALGFVDSVVIFNEEDPLNLIKALMPDILVKGGDWEEDEIIGSDLVKDAGGEVVSIPFISGFSTTDMINRIKSLKPDETDGREGLPF